MALWHICTAVSDRVVFFSVFSELLSRVLGLEGDECDPMDNKMSVTVFQYATYFLSIGSSKAIPKALKQIAQESKKERNEGGRRGESVRTF